MQEVCHHPTSPTVDGNPYVGIKTSEPLPEVEEDWSAAGTGVGGWGGSVSIHNPLPSPWVFGSRIPPEPWSVISVGVGGDRRDISKPTLPGLPSIHAAPAWVEAAQILEPIGLPERVEAPPQERSIPAVADLPAPPIVRSSPSVATGGLLQDHLPQPGQPPMDLGAILTTSRSWLPGSQDIFDQAANIYDLYQNATASPAPAVIVQPTGESTVSTPVVTGGALPAPLPPVMDTRRQYCLKMVNGNWKWVKKTKRRRKRLATATDIKDLSSLKGVLGNGKAFEIWIATHSN